MPVITETATIAALFGLAGQVLQTAIVLYEYIKAYSNIHPRIRDAAKEFYHLYICLSEIWRAASYAVSGTGPPPPCLEAIHASLKRCYEYMRQIESYLDSVKKKKTWKSIVKSLKIAAEKDYFLQISLQLSFRRQELLLLLGTSSWTTNMQLLDIMNRFDTSAEVTRHETQSSMASLQHEVSLLTTATKSIQERLQQLISTTQIPATEALGHASSSAPTAARPTNISSQQDMSVQLLPTTSTPSGTQPMRITSPAILLQTSDGKLQPGLIAIQDTEYTNLSTTDRAKVATLLVQLRLLLWLLQRETWIAGMQMQDISQQSTRGQSSMVLEAGIGARWTYEKVIEWTMTDAPSSSQTYGSRIMFLLVREVSSGGPAFLEAMRRMVQQNTHEEIPSSSQLEAPLPNFRPELRSYVQKNARRVGTRQHGVIIDAAAKASCDARAHTGRITSSSSRIVSRGGP